MFFQKNIYLTLAIALIGIVLSTAEEGCCSHDYKKCINWCGNPNDKDACLNCNHHDGVTWLENGAQKQCRKRWIGCAGKENKCCPGLECRPDDNDYLACLPALETLPPTKEPTKSPTKSPTKAPTEPPKQGCCSHDYKKCINWCGNPKDKEACLNCNHHDGVAWLEDGPARQCAKRWVGCNKQGLNKFGRECCPGLECRLDDNNFRACLPAL